jgi:Uma2 family endonuclease
MAVNTIQVERKLFSVEEYEQMISTGVLNEDDRLELIEGEIIKMSPIGSVHVLVVNRLNSLLAARIGDQPIISIQNPIRLEYSEPQPDVAVLRSSAGLHPQRLPDAGEVLLLIEVADTSARVDQTVKVPLYARGGISECWLVNVNDGSVEVYRGPSASGYRSKETLGAGDTLTTDNLPGLRLAVTDIFAGLPPEH